MSIKAVQMSVNAMKNTLKAKQMMKFFKTGAGEYAQGDVFVGLTNPQCRQIAKNNKLLPNHQLEELLNSQIHEERFIALVIMTEKIKKKQVLSDIYELYLRNIKNVNNWDLVDLSAPNIIGAYLLKNSLSFEQIVNQKDPRKILYDLVQSKSLWERRIAIISTFTFIRAGYFFDTMKLAVMLLTDKEDLIHKAVGWMLREIGKRDEDLMIKFLEQHYQMLPRTILRYAIEKIEEPRRKKMLKGQF